MRSHYGIATSRQVDIPEVSQRGMLVLVHKLADEGRYQLTVLNFANEHVAGTVRSEELPPGALVSDMFTGEPFATVDDLHSFAVEMPAHHGVGAAGRARARSRRGRLIAAFDHSREGVGDPGYRRWPWRPGTMPARQPEFGPTSVIAAAASERLLKSMSAMRFHRHDRL